MCKVTYNIRENGRWLTKNNNKNIKILVRKLGHLNKNVYLCAVIQLVTVLTINICK